MSAGIDPGAAFADQLKRVHSRQGPIFFTPTVWIVSVVPEAVHDPLSSRRKSNKFVGSALTSLRTFVNCRAAGSSGNQKSEFY